MAGTKALADELVAGLTEHLPQVGAAAGLWSVCICGSYPRGDFIDCNSDLDFVVIGPPERDELPDVAPVQTLTDHILDGRRFPSHSPHQFDWINLAWSALPKTKEDITLPDSGPNIRLLNIFLFDFVEHLMVLWGEDPRTVLASPPDVRALAPAWFDRVQRNHQRYLREHNEFRLAFSAFNSTHVAQIVFGERTLDKRRHLELYRTYVPDFPLKEFGCRIIESKLKQHFPDSPPKFAPWEKYIVFESQLADVVRSELTNHTAPNNRVELDE